MINPYPELLSNDIIERAKKLSVATLCDGMGELGIINSGAMDAGIKPLHDDMVVAGTAMTVQTHNGDNLPIHLATFTCKQDGYVIVVDGKGFKERAMVGELMAGAAKATGYKGIIIDGYSRDKKECIELDFPIFSRGLMPAKPERKDKGILNGSIYCGGVPVEPGDLIVGDCDGVCVVPKAHILATLEKAEKKKAYEDGRAKTIADYAKAKAEGAPLPELAPEWAKQFLS